jgi:hypothetical protein
MQLSEPKDRQSMPGRLLIFTRFPEPGQVKTRLIPALGPEGAARLQREMTLHTLHWARELNRYHGIEFEVRFAGANVPRMRAEFGDDVRYEPQCEGNLGDRLATAFAEGASRTIIVGTDCPELSARCALEAFTSLDNHDVVLGPATDGGYYLIGLNRPVPELFQGIAWGTSSVCAQTQRIANERGLSVALLAPLSDVDLPEDLAVWDRVRQSRDFIGKQSRVTVVIPALNEAQNLSATLTPLVNRADIQVIVVDGGSSDDTCQVAQRHRVQVLRSAPGRARQMNAGAAEASGDVLLFLHADTRLPDDFSAHVRRALAQPGVAAGAFRLKICGPSRGLQCVAWGANLRARFWQLPYGDQAIFVSAATFRLVGGFAEMPLMEDVDFIRRVRRLGRIAVAPAAVVTSDRRWQRLGIARTTGLNGLLLGAYFLGFAPDRLVRWYRRAR